MCSKFLAMLSYHRINTHHNVQEAHKACRIISSIAPRKDYDERTLSGMHKENLVYIIPYTDKCELMRWVLEWRKSRVMQWLCISSYTLLQIKK